MPLFRSRDKHPAHVDSGSDGRKSGTPSKSVFGLFKRNSISMASVAVSSDGTGEASPPHDHSVHTPSKSPHAAKKSSAGSSNNGENMDKPDWTKWEDNDSTSTNTTTSNSVEEIPSHNSTKIRSPNNGSHAHGNGAAPARTPNAMTKKRSGSALWCVPVSSHKVMHDDVADTVVVMNGPVAELDSSKQGNGARKFFRRKNNKKNEPNGAQDTPKKRRWFRRSTRTVAIDTKYTATGDLSSPDNTKSPMWKQTGTKQQNRKAERQKRRRHQGDSSSNSSSTAGSSPYEKGDSEYDDYNDTHDARLKVSDLESTDYHNKDSDSSSTSSSEGNYSETGTDLAKNITKRHSTHNIENAAIALQLSDDPRGLVGLKNLGNTCFMSSIIQCLSNTPPLTNYFLTGAYFKNIRKESPTQGMLADSFAELIKELWTRDAGSSVAPTAFKREVSRYAPQFAGYSQQDSQEFLRFLLEGLHEDLNRVKEMPKYTEIKDEHLKTESEKANVYWEWYLGRRDSFILDLFGGQLRSCVECQHCHHRSFCYDPFLDLSLSVPKSSSSFRSYFSRDRSSSVSLVDCFRSYTEVEYLKGDEAYYCGKCKTHQTSTKQMGLWRTPNVLVLHLKRFEWGDMRDKITTDVNYPSQGLDLSEFCYNANDGEAVYDLYGISHHSGGLNGGHYVANCINSDNNKWYTFNDSRVRESAGNSMNGETAYVLFYKKRQTKNGNTLKKGKNKKSWKR